MNNVIPSLNNKVDLASGVLQENVDYVIESYVNGSSWYKVYKSGWCEQGGRLAYTGNNYTTQVAFLKPYRDNNYSLIASEITSLSVDTYHNHAGAGYNLTSTGFDVDVSQLKIWEAKGYIS